VGVHLGVYDVCGDAPRRGYTMLRPCCPDFVIVIVFQRASQGEVKLLVWALVLCGLG